MKPRSLSTSVLYRAAVSYCVVRPIHEDAQRCGGGEEGCQERSQEVEKFRVKRCVARGSGLAGRIAGEVQGRSRKVQSWSGHVRAEYNGLEETRCASWHVILAFKTTDGVSFPLLECCSHGGDDRPLKQSRLCPLKQSRLCLRRTRV
eukprot:2745517-Rhodomonas_salina.1